MNDDSVIECYRLSKTLLGTDVDCVDFRDYEELLCSGLLDCQQAVVRIAVLSSVSPPLCVLCNYSDSADWLIEISKIPYRLLDEAATVSDTLQISIASSALDVAMAVVGSSCLRIMPLDRELRHVMEAGSTDILMNKVTINREAGVIKVELIGCKRRVRRFDRDKSLLDNIEKLAISSDKYKQVRSDVDNNSCRATNLIEPLFAPFLERRQGSGVRLIGTNWILVRENTKA